MRQYIGARYVPKFFEGAGGSPEWVSGIPYEALTIVTYLGSSYTSKKSVPAGIDILNTDYWVCTANFNSQLQNITDSITADEAVLNDLNDYVHTRSSAKYWYIGDSFAAQSDSWCDYLDGYLGTTAHRTAEPSIGYVHAGSVSGLNLADKIAADTADLSDITDVIVVAGINDCNSTSIGTPSVFVTAFRNAMAAIKTKAPNAKIWVTFNATYFNGSQSANSYFISKVYRELCGMTSRLANCRFIKSPFFAIQYKAFIQADGAHPNNSGSNTLAIAIMNKLKDGSDTTPVYDEKVHGINYHLCEMDNVTLSTQYGDVIYDDSSNPFNLSAGVFADIYASFGAPILPKYTYHFAFPARLRLTDTSNVNYEKNCLLLPTIGDKLAILSPDAVSNIKKVIAIDCVKYTVPLMQCL